MGYVPASAPAPRLNLDKRGMPKDYATYMWVVYKRHVADDSPARRAFLEGPYGSIPNFGVQISYR